MEHRSTYLYWPHTRESGRYEEAIYSYQRVLAIKPKYAEVHYQLGLLIE
jgi:hypothetical protein